MCDRLLLVSTVSDGGEVREILLALEVLRKESGNETHQL